MSYWFHIKDGKGRSTTVLVDHLPGLSLVTVCLSVQVFAFCYNTTVRLGWQSTGLMAAGLVALAVAKASLFRQGIWWSWGSGRMTRPFRVLYLAAYALMGAGVLLGCIHLLRTV